MSEETGAQVEEDEDEPLFERPAELDEAFNNIGADSRKANLVGTKKDIEDKLLEAMTNIRIQEDIVTQKAEALEDAADDTTPRVMKLLEESLENAKLILADRYQGAKSLVNELNKIKKSMAEMETAGTAAFGNNRATKRRNKRRNR